MKDKLLKYIRWILFLPVSYIVSLVAVLIIGFINQSYIAGIPLIANLTMLLMWMIAPIVQMYIFYNLIVLMVPSYRILKVRVALIWVIVVSTINISTWLFLLSYKLDVDVSTTFHSIGDFICFIVAFFILCSKEHYKLARKLCCK